MARQVGYAVPVDIRAEFSELLADIEAEMQSVLAERDGHTRPLYEMLAYHLGLDADRARGKRIRPLLGLLAYQSLSGKYREALPGAAAVELGHNFSLVHDDIEDGDRERHHRPTLWAVWGIPLAINAGDAMFALSRLALYRLMDAEGFEERKLLDLMRIYDETCLALTEGQYLDITFEQRVDVSVDEYMEMIGKKTAALLAAAVQAGALLATGDQGTIEAYRQFGYDLGLAFQMADDVKGTFWESEDSGKPSAGDVRRRKKTLPLVWALQNAAPADVDRLRDIYRTGLRATDGLPAPDVETVMAPDEVDEVLAILDRSGARAHAEGEARRYRDRALAELAALPIPDERRIELEDLVQAIIRA